MTPDQLKQLRTELACTAKELALTLGLEQADVMAWEKGERFPTKNVIGRMEALRAKGPAAIVRKAKGSSTDPLKVLADPLLWELVRKLAAHKALRDQVAKIAAEYKDPAADERVELHR